MTFEHSENAASDEPAQGSQEEPQESVTGGGDGPAPGDSPIPAKQIHRWKGEGGALHPND